MNFENNSEKSTFIATNYFYTKQVEIPSKIVLFFPNSNVLIQVKTQQACFSGILFFHSIGPTKL